jgi:CRISPR-associated exonuclease Cas4
MFAESDLLPLSGLQHFTFCERRWALVQIEGIWDDNRFTAEGSVLHARVHSDELESRPNLLIRRTLPIHSFRLGLSGQADVIEFTPAKAADVGIPIEGRSGLWRPFPIEYKRTKGRRPNSAYHVQLCGQAMCLEEMYSVPVKEGALYDATARRRETVDFPSELRALVERAAARMHQLLSSGTTPPPILTKACQSCSLVERCQPRALSTHRSVSSYLANAMNAS